MDDLDFNGGQVLGHYMKIWGDKWACTGEVKGGTIPLNHQRIVVTSNYSIQDIFGPEDTDSEKVRKSKNELVAAIARRFKQIFVET